MVPKQIDVDFVSFWAVLLNFWDDACRDSSFPDALSGVIFNLSALIIPFNLWRSLPFSSKIQIVSASSEDFHILSMSAVHFAFLGRLMVLYCLVQLKVDA